MNGVMGIFIKHIPNAKASIECPYPFPAEEEPEKYPKEHCDRKCHEWRSRYEAQVSGYIVMSAVSEVMPALNGGMIVYVMQYKSVQEVLCKCPCEHSGDEEGGDGPPCQSLPIYGVSKHGEGYAPIEYHHEVGVDVSVSAEPFPRLGEKYLWVVEAVFTRFACHETKVKKIGETK